MGVLWDWSSVGMYRCVECSFHAGSVKLKEFFLSRTGYRLPESISIYVTSLVECHGD